MLYSIGKDSAVMVHLARKAFHPSPPPFPLLHVDTTWKFRAMYELRDTVAERHGVDLIVYQNPECVERGINPITHGSALHTDLWKTEGLKQALDKYGFDLAFGGARGANIALMVEVMAAGLAGANWALDAPSFVSGDRSPGAGLLVIAITPALLAPDFPQRLRLQLDRLAKLGVRIPGRRAAATEIELPDALAAEIERAGAA